MRGPGKSHVLAIRQVSGSALPIGAGKSEYDRQLRKPSHFTSTLFIRPQKLVVLHTRALQRASTGVEVNLQTGIPLLSLQLTVAALK